MSTGISNEERHANKIIYVGKQVYRHLCEINTEIVEARRRGVSDKELGVFAELDVKALIAEAKRIGNVPEWNAEDTPVGKKLSYPQGTTGVNQ